MLKILVCVKQVPESGRIDIDPSTGALVRGSACTITNPDDLHALEMALSLKERFGARITALTMGPPCAEDALREAVALGADEAVLISDPVFSGSDSLVTSKILSRAMRKLGVFDIIVTGVETTDGNTSSVGYQLSEFLSVPLITRIHKIEIRNDSAIIERLYGHEYQKILVKLPILLAVGRDSNTVRFPGLADIHTCFDRKIAIMTMADIGGFADEYGFSGSPTMVLKYETFSHARAHERIDGSLDDKVRSIVQKLRKHNIIHS